MVGYGPIAKGVAMFSDRRHEAILARLTQAGEVAVGPLATELGCAVETIRRDLAELEQRGQIKRVHGGAVQVPPAEQPPIATRQVRDRKVRDAIAAAAAALVPAGAHIWLGAGSTVLALAVRLFDLPARTTFATNMIDVARLLARSRHQVFLAGGEINADSMAQNGAETLDFIEARYFDLAIVGGGAACGPRIDGPDRASPRPSQPAQPADRAADGARRVDEVRRLGPVSAGGMALHRDRGN